MQTVKCISKIQDTVAVKLTPENISEVCKWCRLNYVNNKHIGQWVVSDHGKFMLMDQAEFESKYDLLEEKQ